MLSRLITFDRQCREAIELSRATPVPIEAEAISNIVVSGLGGSAIGGDLLRVYLDNRLNIPIFINRDYALPTYVSHSSLLFVVSYSGNTEETLSVFNAAFKGSIPMVCITSGGLLYDWAVEKKRCVVQIPTGYPPRTALGFLFIPMLMVLTIVGLLEDLEAELEETIALLRRKAAEYHPTVPTDKNKAKQLSAHLHDLIPILYASERFYPVAQRWRTQIEENAEGFAHSNVFPELHHNEIMGWQGLRQFGNVFTTILFRDKGDMPQIQKRMEISRQLLESDGLSITEVWSEGDFLLTRLFSLICLGDFVSFYAAILKGLDPTPVDRIECLKKQLKDMEA